MEPVRPVLITSILTWMGKIVSKISAEKLIILRLMATVMLAPVIAIKILLERAVWPMNAQF
jgi:hypothetical protein